jgi:hypothetical protein
MLSWRNICDDILSDDVNFRNATAPRDTQAAIYPESTQRAVPLLSSRLYLHPQRQSPAIRGVRRVVRCVVRGVYGVYGKMEEDALMLQ